MPGWQYLRVTEVVVGVPSYVGQLARKVFIENDVFRAMPIDFNDIETAVVRPSMLDFTLARRHVQGFCCPLNVTRFEGDRVNSINRNMAMDIVRVAMDGEHILVLGQTKGFEGMLCGIEYRV